MFIASVIAFIAGIYIEASHPCHFRFSHILISLFSIAAALPFLLNKRFAALTGALLLAAFFLAGMLRMTVVFLHQPTLPVAEEASLFRGVIAESSKTSKVIRLDDPLSLSGMRALVRSGMDLGIGDRVFITGTLRQLRANFNNPHSISWKGMKRLEGTYLEIKGEILSASTDKRLVDVWRRYLSDRIDASGPSHAGIIKALTIGDTTDVDDRIKTLFLETGVSHILAVSGSNLGIITAFFFIAARFLLRRSSRMRQGGGDQRYAALVTVPFAVLFMFTAGSTIPVVRATIMVCIFMIAVFLERGKHIENTLMLSVLVILIIYPHSLFSPTFQLTFTSMLFIILFARAFSTPIARSRRSVRWLASLTLMTAAAMLGTLPVVLYHFHGINPLAILYNIVAVPLISVAAMPLALLGLFVPFGDHLLRLSGSIIGLTVGILHDLNWGYLYPVIRPSLPEALLYLLVVISLVFIKKRLLRLSFFAFILPAAIITVSIACYKRFYSDQLCVSHIDVGLGDAILIEAPRGKRLLIDAGGFYMSDFDTGKTIMTPLLLSGKILTIDHVINTHPHEDHLGGLRYILRHFQVGRFNIAANTAWEPQYRHLEQILKKRGISTTWLKRGDSIVLDSGLVIDVLHPPENTFIDDLNEMSLVLKMTFDERSFLFTGDIGADTEELLVLSDAPLRSSVLKVPHHGSRHSSSIHFIKAAAPQAAVLSTGPGIKGIPSDEIIKRYQALSVPLYRTDRDGCVKVCTDGKKLNIEHQ